MRKFLLFLFLIVSKVSFSQVNDNFSDGDFSQNPIWTADLSTSFTVFNQQLRSNSTIANSNFYISTPNTKALNCAWEFDINLQFSTSGANYVDVYLISNVADLKSANINGYFLRMGNTADEVALYRRSGLTSTSIKIIDGLDGAVGSSNNNFKFRITRTSAGVFNLERDDTGTGNSFISEGTVTDNTFTISSSFGFLVQQSTTTFHQKHFFDNVVIQDIFVDNTPPTLNTLVVNSGTQLTLTFNEAVNPTDAAILSHYVVNPGNIQPSSVTAVGSNVVLNFANEFSTGTFNLAVNTIKDLSGNAITAPIQRNFNYRRPYTAVLNDIVINEIFADPSPQIDLPSVEFVELYNRSTEDIALVGFTYADGSSTYTFGVDTIKANQYLILCARADTAEYKPFGKVLGISPWPSLNNASDGLVLKNQNGLVISSVAYADTWYRDNVKKSGGWTLERIDPFSKCVEALGWTASKAIIGGTPGKQNSVFIANYDALTFKVDSFKKETDSTLVFNFSKPLETLALNKVNFELQPNITIKNIITDISNQQIKLLFDRNFAPATSYQIILKNLSDCSQNTLTGTNTFNFRIPPLRPDTAKILITEIFADASPEVGLPLAEFVEIYNTGKDTVDLKDFTLSNGSNTRLKITSKILPNQYIILCNITDTLQYQPFGKVIGVSSFPSLTNSLGSVILRSHTGKLIDSVTYTDQWYKDAVKKLGGWTLEKIDLNQKSCNPFYNWAASKNIKGGTPGTVNSISKTFVTANDLAIENISILNDSTVRVSLNFFPDTARLAQFKFTTNLLGDPKRIVFDKNNLQSFTLTYGQLFKEATTYQISITGISNCSGLILNKPASFTTPFIIPINYPVVINEIFADPSPVIGLPDSEFFELKNLSNSTVSLAGMIYENDRARIVFNQGSIEPNGFVIVCPARDTLSYQTFGKTIGLSSFPSLNNNGSLMVLKNNKGVEFYKVPYDLSWYGNRDKQNGGYSLELIDPASLCGGKQNWLASNAQIGGTPGKENSIHLINKTNIPFQLLNATLKDSLTISLTFNRALDSLQATLPNQYSINNGVGVPQLVTPIGPGFATVDIKYNQALSRNQTYTITVNGVTDCGGSAISSQTKSFVYPGAINRNDILLNEILFNPRSGGVDFVEVYNNSNKILDFKDLSIATTNDRDSLISARPISATTLLFQPQTYWVITSNPDTVKAQYQTQNPNNFIKISSLPSYNDDSGKAILVNKINARVDQLNYDSDMHFALLRDLNGVSLERSSFEKPTNEKGNFRSAAASVGYATPAYKNSQFLESVTGAEEISLASETFSPDNDGFEDVLRILYNFSQPDRAANVTIYNDQGRLIKKLIRNETTAAQGEWIWDGLDENNAKVKTGIYIIYAELFDLSGNVKKYKKTAVAASRFD